MFAIFANVKISHIYYYHTMEKTFTNRLKKILILAVVLNLFIIVMQGLNTKKTIQNSKNSLILIGKTALSSFEGGRRAQLLLNPEGGQRFRTFVDMIGENSGVLSLYLFDQSGEVLFNSKEITPPQISPIELPHGMVETDAGMLLYQTLPPPRPMMGRMMGQNAPRWMQDDRNLVAGVMLDTTEYKNMVRTEVIFLAWMFFLELILIAVYVYTARMIRVQTEQSKRLSAAEHEAELGKMSRVMAHELKNPLSSVKGLMEFSAKKLEGDLKDISDRCVEELSRLDRIINDYLAYGKDITLNVKDTDLKAVSENIAKLLEIDADEKDIAVKLEGSGQIKADTEKMKQVIFNLMLNAIQGAPANSEIQMTISEKSIIIKNEVSDTSFETENLGKPFYTTKTVGTGLGLAIVKRICKLHSFDVKIDAGKVFSVQINF
ncbi:MAG: hypothetical protein C0602_03690 [Denitrovibrio sp.]|nr:MAG: hypothetical protein C0602_03690 [Denitrovibrio sp.]